MVVLIAVIVFLWVLRANGRLGPLVWDPPHDQGPHRWRRCVPEGPVPAEDSADPETVLARRLADGELTSEEYLERLSLLRER